MVDTCRLSSLLTRDINIEALLELYRNYDTTEKRPYQYNKLLHERS